MNTSAVRQGFLKCNVFLGIFNEEYTVKIYLGNDNFAGSWVGNRNVIVTSGEVGEDQMDPEPAEGWLRVAVRRETPEGILIQLPAEAFTGQLSFVVPGNIIEYNPA